MIDSNPGALPGEVDPLGVLSHVFCVVGSPVPRMRRSQPSCADVAFTPIATVTLHHIRCHILDQSNVYRILTCGHPAVVGNTRSMYGRTERIAYR
jgi:hypothetical protein